MSHVRRILLSLIVVAGGTGLYNPPDAIGSNCIDMCPGNAWCDATCQNQGYNCGWAHACWLAACPNTDPQLYHYRAVCWCENHEAC
jgi:hypothetical protein